jgi:hypothetical protein
MPQAKITVNSVPGSNVNLPINTLVQLDNQNAGGELTYTWSILDKPPTSVDTLSSVSVQNPVFTPKVEGTYLIKLVVNQGLPTEQEDRVVCAVLQLKTLERIPAAGETTEADTSDGWATASNSYLRRMDALLVDPGVMVGVNASGGTLVRGNIVRAPGVEFIKATLPGAEGLPGFTLAHANVLGEIDELLCVVESDITGVGVSIPGTGPTEARLMRVRYIGRFVAITGSPAAGDTVYVNDGGSLSLTPGTIRRRVGSVMTGAYTNDVWFNGVGGADIDLTPIDRAYVVWGNPGALPNALRVDGANATGQAGVPFRIKANAAIGLQVVGAAGQNIQEWYDSGVTMRAHITPSGDLAFDATSGITWPTAQRIYASGVNGLVLENLPAGGGLLQFATVAATLQALIMGGTGLPTFVVESFAAGLVILGTNTNHPLDFTTNSASKWRINATGELTAVSADRAIQKVLDPVSDQDAATKFYADLTVGPTNYVQNAGFDWAQRGTLFTTSTTLATTIRAKTLDRWWSSMLRVLAGAALTQNISRGTGPGPTSRNNLSWEMTANGGGSAWTHVIAQELDRDLVRKLRGKKLAISVQMLKQLNFTGAVRVEVVAGTGTETQAWDAYTGGTDVYREDFTPTGSWATYRTTAPSINVVVPANATTLALRFILSSTANASATTFNSVAIAEPMLTPTKAMSAAGFGFVYHGGTRLTDQLACMEYVESSFNHGDFGQTAAAGASITNGSSSLSTTLLWLGTALGGTTVEGLPLQYKVRKKYNFASGLLGVTVYDTAGLMDAVIVSNTGSQGAQSQGVSEVGFYPDLSPSGAQAQGAWLRLYYLADCDIF